MEEAKSKLIIDYETKRNIYKYQYAFLAMKRSIAIFAMQNDKRTFLYWKNLAICEISSQKIFSDETLSNLRFALATFNRVSQNNNRSVLQAALFKIFEYSSIKRMKDLKNKEQKKIEAVHQFELGEMNNELQHLQQKQTELQSIMVDLRDRELEYIGLVDNLNSQRLERYSKHEKSRLRTKEREDEITERITELKEENSELKEKLHSVEKNVAVFIKNMAYLLEHERVARRAAGTPRVIDDLNYKEKKSPASTQRRVKNTPRSNMYTGNSKHPLINIDMVK